MTVLGDGRGTLYPSQLPTFHREPAPEEFAERIRWFWIPRWDLLPGTASEQRLLPFPASNLVVEPGGVVLSGPATGFSSRRLEGRGWAVGALLRPAGVAGLGVDPSRLRDSATPFDAPDLHDRVSEAMERRIPDETAEAVARLEAVRACCAWAEARIAQPDEGGALANAMEDLISSDRSVLRVDHVAERLGLSTRGVQRLAQRYFGVAPLAIIRRYRLQEAAQRLRDDPSLTISRVAADLCYADHSHLTSDFRRVLGFTPDAYRRDPGHAGHSAGQSEDARLAHRGTDR